VAGGPDIRAGYEDEYPSGNIDVGATILHLLGLTHPDGADGRVLTEALAGEPASQDKMATRNIVARRPLPNGGEWKQYLRVSRFRGKSYFDEGNVGE